MLKFSITPQNDTYHIYFVGEIDIDSTEIIEDDIFPQVKHATKVNIDMSRVTFIDSTGIGLLIKIVNDLRSRKSIVTISNITLEVKEIFDLLQIPNILGEEIFEEN